jgi:deoxyadenosine/deoxycytidine kinase
MGKLIVIEGIIGIGKSTFADIISERRNNFTWLKEPVEGNIVLAEFYKDMKRWSFALQMDYLYKRFEQHYHANNTDGIFIMDRGIIGDEVFVNMLVKDGMMHPLEAEVYRNCRDIMLSMLKPADLCVYLQGTPERAHKQAMAREREIEKDLSLKYLQRLDEEYTELYFDNPSEFTKATPIYEIEWYVEDYMNTIKVFHTILQKLGV